MPYTTQRNYPNGGGVIVTRNNIEVFFKKDGQRAIFTVSAKKILSLPVVTKTDIRMNGVTVICEKRLYFWVPIKDDDYTVKLYLNEPIDGSCDLMIVSRRGLRRAARKALQLKRRAK